MMKLNLISTLGLSAFLLGACALNPFSGNNNSEEEAQDKAGRISMVSAEEQLQADPDMISTAVILPDATPVTSWAQAGRIPNKVTGHLRAGEEFVVDWTSGQAAGSDTNRALTVAPIAADGKIFVMDALQTVIALDAETGKTVWRERLSSGNKRDKRVFGGGLAYHDGRLVVASGFGFVTALDANTGTEIWKEDTMSPMTGSPTIIGDRIFISSNNNEFFAISLETGAVQWTDQAIAESARVLASPSAAAVDDFVVVPYSSGEVIAYLPSNGRRLWSDSLTRAGRFTPISAINDIASRPVLSAGLVYASSQSGVLAAIDGRSGSRVWSLPFGTTQAPVVAGEYVFAVGVDGQLICVEAVSGRVIWTEQLPAYRNEEKKRGRISYSGPILASNRLVTLSSDGRMSAFSPQTGELLEEKNLIRIGRFGADAGFFLEPIVYDGSIIALADNGRLFSIR